MSAGPPSLPAGLAPFRNPLTAAVAGAALLVAHAALFWRYTVDDAFISFRYAENWARGFGPVFNPGEWVEGYTNFLWVALLAVAHRVGLDAPVTAKLLGLACAAGVLAATVVVVDRAWGRPAGWFGALLLASSGIFAVNAVDGLKTQAFTLASWCSILLLAHERRRDAAFPASLVLALAAVLLRPDGLLLVGAMVGLHGLEAVRHPQSVGVRRLAWALALTAAALAAYTTWRWETYGELLPNTFFAKGGGSSTLVVRGVERVGAFVGASGSVLVCALAAVGLGRRLPGGLGLLAAGWIALRLAFTVWSGGEWMGTHRFMAPALPAIALLAVGGVHALHGFARRRLAGAGAAALAAACAIAVVSLNLGQAAAVRRAALGYAAALERAHVTLGRALFAATGGSGSLACEDIGALPYYSRLVTVDMLGLADRYIARLPGAFYDKVDPAYILGRAPDWLVLISRTAPPQAFVGREKVEAGVYRHPWFGKRYRFEATVSFAPEYNLCLFRRIAGPS